MNEKSIEFIQRNKRKFTEGTNANILSWILHKRKNQGHVQ